MIATAEQEDPTTTTTSSSFKIKVTNISPLVKEEILKKLFSFIGTVSQVELRQLDAQSVESLKEALVEFQTEDDVELSIHLTGVILVDRPLMVVKYTAKEEEEKEEADKQEATTNNNNEPQINNPCSVNLLNIPRDFCTDDELRKFFVACGTLKSIQRQQNDLIVLEFSSQNYKQVALKLNSHYFKGLKLRIQDPLNPSEYVVKEQEDVGKKQDDAVSITSSSAKREHYRRGGGGGGDDYYYDHRDRYSRDYYYSSNSTNRDRNGRSRRDYDDHDDDYYYKDSSSRSRSRRRRHDY